MHILFCNIINIIIINIIINIIFNIIINNINISIIIIININKPEQRGGEVQNLLRGARACAAARINGDPEIKKNGLAVFCWSVRRIRNLDPLKPHLSLGFRQYDAQKSRPSDAKSQAEASFCVVFLDLREPKKITKKWNLAGWLRDIT